MTIQKSLERMMVGRWALVALVCAGWLPADAVVAQDAQPARRQGTLRRPEPRPAPPPPAVKPLRAIPVPVARPAEDSELEVYRLRYADAGSVLEALGAISTPHVAGPISLAMDKRTNSILVVAPPETQELLSELIDELDVVHEPGQTELLTMYQLKYADPASVVAVLSEIVGSENTRIAVDERTRCILLASPPETHQSVEALLKVLDVPRPTDHGQSEPSATYRVRVVWLASGLAGDEADKPCDDLKGVVAELSKVGVGGLCQVGQVIVNTMPDGQFKIRCSPVLGQQSVDLDISGSVDRQREPPTLNLQASAVQLVERTVTAKPSAEPRQEEYGEFRELVNLETIISAPSGQYVVLGVTPIGTMTSAFVVQVTPNKPK